MTDKKNIAAFYIAGIIFVLADAILIMERQNYLLAMLPFALLVVYLALFKLDTLMLAVVFFTPLSINIEQIPGLNLGQVGVGVALPTEPIMFGILLLFILRLAYGGIDKKLISHPVSIVILAGIGWMFITSVTSTMPFVSFKYLVERCWGVATFYFLGICLFDKIKNITTFCWLYIISLTGVVFYTTIRHAAHHFAEKSAQLMPSPFYNDHTAYGAMLAMFLPVIIGFMVLRLNNKTGRVLAPFFALALLIGLGFSFSRAAWVSTAAAIVVWVVMLLKIRLRTVLIIMALGFGIAFIYQQQIMMKLEKNNKQVSGDITTDIQSISNISSDASNRERINRWSCAISMFQAKPLLGFGPGTYSFKYAPFQLSYNRTIISTNLGNGGNAHSEYLGPLAEEGILGLLSYLAIVIVVTIISFNLYYNLSDKELRIIVLSVYLGLVTYFVHSVMNNFLDTDKAAVPFWGFIAILVAIDLKYGHKKEKKLIEQAPAT